MRSRLAAKDASRSFLVASARKPERTSPWKARYAPTSTNMTSAESCMVSDSTLCPASAMLTSKPMAAKVGGSKASTIRSRCM